MINAYRRGEIAGSQGALAHPEICDEGIVRQCSTLVFVWYKQAQYAHIEPEQDFLSGFVASFLLILEMRRKIAQTQ